MTTQTTLSATELNEEFGEFAEMLSERYDNLFSKEQVLNVIPTYLEHLEEDGDEFGWDTVHIEAMARYAMGRANNLHKLLEHECGIVNGTHKFIQVNPEYVLPTKEEMTKKYHNNWMETFNAF
jgi:hypothetical protein|tara:strand:+ start:205 stop:573 length:369 start_codon:yes stop_codon:yes gene_type:complete